MPWINAIFLAEIVLDIYLLRKAAWDTVTRITKIIVEGASLALAVVFIRTTDLIGFTVESFTNSPFSPEQAQTFITVATYGYIIAMTVVIIIVSIELIKAIYGLLRSSKRAK